MTFEEEREATIQQLCRHFANDLLTTQELDARLEAAYRAASAEELRALTANLPVPAPQAPDPGAFPEPVPSAHRKGRVTSVFASVHKRGDWEPPEHLRATSIFGELKLDFREARIRPGVTHVHVFAKFGTVNIIVPPGVFVDCDGSAFFGEFSERIELMPAAGADAPTLRITGMAIFGEVKVETRLPDDERDMTRLQKLKRGLLG
jgi:hypothetical protein